MSSQLMPEVGFCLKVVNFGGGVGGDTLCLILDTRKGRLKKNDMRYQPRKLIHVNETRAICTCK